MTRSIALLALLLLSCDQAQHRSQTGNTEQAINAKNEEVPAASDHIRAMSYNVLRFGDGCQGNNASLQAHLQRIVNYVKPDVLGLIKVAAIGDRAPAGFQDSIVRYALNRNGSHFAVLPFTNAGGAKDINLLFINQDKMGYSGMQTLVSDVTDFNLYKLYEKAGTTKGDTAFLYVLLLHTESGDESTIRDRQLETLVKSLKKNFKTMPPMLVLGDFNLRNTSEPGYYALTQSGSGAPLFNDPPFALDKSVRYPADWESDPDHFARFLTTSTRKRDDEPNDCGTGGGAKSWYDHILVSPAIAAGSGHFSYVPGSFHVVGNDGDRAGRSVYSEKHPNKAVPPAVAEALFQFSNKYPVVIELSAKR